MPCTMVSRAGKADNNMLPDQLRRSGGSGRRATTRSTTNREGDRSHKVRCEIRTVDRGVAQDDDELSLRLFVEITRSPTP